MILVTGGTGFIGSALVKRLAAMNEPVRILLRPSKTSPMIPKSVPVEVTLAGLSDERGLRASMKGVRAVFHLIGTERLGIKSDLNGVDVEGTASIMKAAREARLDQVIAMSYLGADKASAYPVMKAKGLAEEIITSSGIPYTIFRSSVVFGEHDHFTHQMARLIRALPFFFLMPGDGSVMLQPLWVEDLVTVLAWSLRNPRVEDQIYSIGGAEYLSFQSIIKTLQEKLDLRRTTLHVSPPFLRILNLMLDQVFHLPLVSIFWLDYLATDRTCPVDALPRLMGLMPARFHQHLEYLEHRS